MSAWRIEMHGHGRAGSIKYFEDTHEASFGWELGGADIVFIITGPPWQDWDEQLPWAVGRREELLARIAREIIRTQAPQCSFELADGGVTALIRKRVQPFRAAQLTRRGTGLRALAADTKSYTLLRAGLHR